MQVQEGLVIFRNVKEEKLKSKRRGHSRRAVKDRTVPIVFQWVQEALTEIQAIGAKRGTAVAVNTEGDNHKGSGQATNAFSRRLRELGLKRTGYSLKACQRAAIGHLEQFLPPWVVARIAGHSLQVHMDRYSKNESHLVAPPDRDYGPFGALSAIGRRMVVQNQRHGLAQEMMDRGQL
jgi:hypothetical protein